MLGQSAVGNQRPASFVTHCCGYNSLSCSHQVLFCPTASGSQTSRIFLPMSTTCREGPSHNLSVHALKYALATLIQSVASTLRHQLFEHASDCFYSIHQMIQLRKLSLGERSPALRRASDVAETKEQVSDFSQCETQLTRTLNDCQAVKHRRIITPLPT